MGLGVALIAVPNVLQHIESGALRRVLPDWYADLGEISLYFTNQKPLPAKTRAFVDHIIEAFREQKLARRFSANGRPRSLRRAAYSNHLSLPTMSTFGQ